MTDNLAVNDDSSRAHMDALTASDEMHRKAMRRVAEQAELNLKGNKI